VFAHVPLSSDIARDMQRIRLDRGMGYYGTALDWAKRILQGVSPVSGAGSPQRLIGVGPGVQDGPLPPS
jgi:5-methylcytosine-specific restriction enzyme subunit McrC